jgi:glycosyltransferase involved in cell wall biosynthesis
VAAGPRVKLTVAIPTHNRAATLRQTLDSVRALDLGGRIEAECVVVDNHCTDSTALVVEELGKRSLIELRRVIEPRVGSSFARNRGVAEARGDFIFFLDDDVIVEANWALVLLDEIERRGLDAACGAVLPRWAHTPPRWLGPRLYPKLSVHPQAALDSPDGGALETLEHYFSANVGFRRATFERFGRFREDLGVFRGNPIGGEETDLFARIIAGGGKIGFAPRARVHHLIPPQRMTRSYLRRKSFTYGIGSAVAGGPTHNRLDKLAKNVWRMIVAAARGDSEAVVYHQLECMNFLGYWRGRLMRRRAQPN